MAKSYKVFQGKDGQWYYSILGENGEVMATSEGYTRHRDATRGVAALRLRLSEPSTSPIAEANVGYQKRKLTHRPVGLGYDPGMA